MINSDLQYILLNSEPTVSFLLLKKKIFKKTKKTNQKSAKAEPIGRFSTDQKINLSSYTVFTNIISKCIYNFSRN